MSTTVSSTGVVDTDGFTWAFGTYLITVHASGSLPYAPQYSGSLDALGAFTVVLPAMSTITSAPDARWSFLITPNATSGAFTVLTTISGTTQDVTSLLNASATGPRFPAGPTLSPYGYGTVEVSPNPIAGSLFYDVTTEEQFVWSGSAWVASGGGGSLPTATKAGQIISASAAGTTYAVQGNVYYQQTGDTIASIETQCSVPSTYVVTSPATITLTGNHTLSSNVYLRFEADGKWTVNGGGFTLTINNPVEGTISTHFPAGTGSVKFGPVTSLLPVEWFGAVGDWNGSSGTDNTTTIQAAVTALTTGQILLQALPYAINGTIATTSGVGIKGSKYGYYTNGKPSRIINQSASADTVTATGSSGTYFTWNVFEDFEVARSVVPTGTASGLSLSFVGGATVNRVFSNDSFRGFYLHACPAYGVGSINYCQAAWGYAGITETSGSYYGFYLDSADGNAENSIRLNYCAATANHLSAITTYGLYINGKALNDIFTYGFESAVTNYGVYINYTGAGGSIATSDIHITDAILDGSATSCLYISGTTAATNGSVQVSGGHFELNGTGKVIDIENSYGIVIMNVAIQSTANTPTHGIYANGSTNVVLLGNRIQVGSTAAIELAATTNSVVSGNTSYSQGTNGILLSGVSTKNVVTSNTITGSGSGITNGVNFGASTVSNVGTQTNAFSGTVTNTVVDTGTTNSANVPSTINGLISASTNITITGAGTAASPYAISASGAAGSAFNTITGGTNTTAAMVVGSGGSLDITGTGINNASKVNGVAITGTPSAGYVPTATSSSAATWQAVGGGAMTLISDQLLGSPAATVTFSSISGSYKHLKIFIQAACSGAVGNDGMYMQANGDTGANYSRQYSIVGGSAAATNGQTLSSATGAGFPIVGASGFTNGAGLVEITIPNYVGTTFLKQANMYGQYWTASAQSNFVMLSLMWYWASTAAITQLVFGPASGSNFITGSRFTLYGIS